MNTSIYQNIATRTAGDIYIGEPYIMGLNPKLVQRAEDLVPFFIQEIKPGILGAQMKKGSLAICQRAFRAERVIRVIMADFVPIMTGNYCSASFL